MLKDPGTGALNQSNSRRIKTALQTEDVAVIIDAKHLCVSSRGVQDDTSATQLHIMEDDLIPLPKSTNY